MADDITVKVGFDGTKAESGLGKLRKESDSFATQLTTRMAGAFAAMTLFDRGIGFALKTFEKFADVSDKAERAGISAEDFQRIGYAAELSGTSMEAAAKAMREIRNATADAANGSKKATEALLALGYTQAEITKGDIKSTDVLLKMAAAYKAAGSDAAKFNVATSILSTRSASEMMPFLATSQGDLQTAMNRDVASQALVDQMKALADQAKEASQALEMFAVEVFGAVSRGYGSTAIIGMQTQIEDEARKAEALRQSGDIKGARASETEALRAFAVYSRYFRMANTGTIDEEGNLMTAKRTDEILKQKFDEMFPNTMKGQNPFLQTVNAASTSGLPADIGKKEFGVVASSLAQVGGGGGVYVTDMVDLATRTANATERAANALEIMAGLPSAESSPVSSE